MRRVSEDSASVAEIRLYKKGGRSEELFECFITENLNGKSFVKATPFGGEEQDLVIAVNGKDVRDFDDPQVKEILRKKRGGKLWHIRFLKRSAANWTALLGQKEVSKLAFNFHLNKSFSSNINVDKSEFVSGLIFKLTFSVT